MRYELGFHPDALAEWRKLDATVSEQFKKRLVERLQRPRGRPLSTQLRLKFAVVRGLEQPP